MERRTFGRLAISAAATALAGPALGENRDDDDFTPRIPPFGRVAIGRSGKLVRIESVLLITENASFARKIGADLPQFSEDRVTTSGLLGDILRPTPKKMLNQTNHIGNVVLTGKSLIVLPDAANFTPPRDTTLYHGDRSWDIPSLRPAKVTGLSSIPVLRTLFSVGSARASKSELVIFIRPVITLQDDDY